MCVSLFIKPIAHRLHLVSLSRSAWDVLSLEGRFQLIDEIVQRRYIFTAK